MASTVLLRARQPVMSTVLRAARFSSSRQLLNAPEAAVPAQGLGAFRGGLLGFLAGSTVAGASAYYYILQEFRLSNAALTEDIYALQAATQRLGVYIAELEAKADQVQKRI